MNEQDKKRIEEIRDYIGEGRPGGPKRHIDMRWLLDLVARQEDELQKYHASGLTPEEVVQLQAELQKYWQAEVEVKAKNCNNCKHSVTVNRKRG